MHLAQATQATMRAPVHSVAPAPWLALAALICAALLPILMLRPPAVVPASAPATTFSAARAMAHVRDLAQRPRPVGSAENARVRAAIVAQLQSLGLAPEVQAASSTVATAVAGGTIVTSADIHNVVVRVPGTGDGAAIVLIAHYDTVRSTPGAFDNGSGIAVLLETARALRSGPSLRNDIILLFTDAEEVGRLGARAFVERHPWAADTRLALNVDAAGAGGPVVLFETSPANGPLVAGFAAAAPRPATSSLLPSLYRLLPNDTDLTPFLERGIAGMNFAFADDNAGYHAGGDTADRLDARSLQQQGANLLALARHFGDRDLGALAAAEANFFTLPGLGVVHYPRAWSLPLVALGTLGVAGVVALGLRRRTLTAAGVALGAMALLGVALGLGVLGWLAVEALGRLRPDGLGVWNGGGGIYDIHRYELGLLALLVIAGALATGLAQRVIGWPDLLAGALLLWLGLAGITGILLPGASYLFVWPLLAALPVLGIRIAGRALPRGVGDALMAVPPLAGVLLLAPALYFLLLLLKLTAIPLLGPGVALLLGLAAPLDLRGLPRAWAWPAGLAAAVAIGLVALAVLSGFGAERPRVTHLAYSLDAGTGAAAWLSLSHRPDAWTNSFLGPRPEDTRARSHAVVPALLDQPARAARAIAAPLQAPAVRVVDDTTAGTARRLRLRIIPPRPDAEIVVLLEAAGGISEARLAGARRHFPTPQSWLLRYRFGAPSEGDDLEVQLRAGDTLHVHVADLVAGLPALDGQPPQRPADLMSFETGFPPGDTTIVHRRLSFPARP